MRMKKKRTEESCSPRETIRTYEQKRRLTVGDGNWREVMEEEPPRVVANDRRDYATEEGAQSATDQAPQSSNSDGLDLGRSSPTEILKVVEVVERDSIAISESFFSLFSSLRSALAEVTGSSVEHMRCFGDAVGSLQESTLDASSKGNRFINSCLRLNEEMKGIQNLAGQLKYLRRNVDELDAAVDKILQLP